MNMTPPDPEYGHCLNCNRCIDASEVRGDKCIECQHDNVVNIADYRPHIVLPGLKTVHVIPVELIQGLIDSPCGIPTADTEMVQDILQDWLKRVTKEQDDGK